MAEIMNKKFYVTFSILFLMFNLTTILVAISADNPAVTPMPGIYPNSSVPLGANTTIPPDAPTTGARSIIYQKTDFTLVVLNADSSSPTNPGVTGLLADWFGFNTPTGTNVSALSGTASETYVIGVRTKGYQFNPQVISVSEEIKNDDFTAEP